MEIILITLLLAVLMRIGDLATRFVPVESFLDALNTESNPAVMVVNRRILWLITWRRNYYVQNYKGFKLGCASFTPLDIPEHVDIIPVQKW